MNPSDEELEKLDTTISLSLQKLGMLVPRGIELPPDIDDPNVKLPKCLEDTDSVVSSIFERMDSDRKTIKFPGKSKVEPVLDEISLAARSGDSGLSKSTLDRIMRDSVKKKPEADEEGKG